MFCHSGDRCTDLVAYSIIQDCEDALTNWVEKNAAVSSKLSVRARNLSQRRHQNPRTQGEGVDLASQDQPMKDRDSGLWVPAGAHREHLGGDYEDEVEEEEEEEEAHEGHGSHVGAPASTNGEQRGREEERAQVA